LLAIGAAISGVLVPHFTQQYQRRSQDLELKTTLIKELNQTTRPLFESFVQAEVTSSSPSSVAAAKHAFLVWLVARDAVHDDFSAYFPDARRLQQAWDVYGDMVAWAGRIVGNTLDRVTRREVAERRYPRWRGLGDCAVNCADARYAFWKRAMIQLEQDTRASKQAVIAELLKAHSAL
jgi:hypothetical protein